MYVTETKYSTQTPKKSTLFSGQYLCNRSTLDIGVLGYIGIVLPKKHSPEVVTLTRGTFCIYFYNLFEQRWRSRYRDNATGQRIRGETPGNGKKFPYSPKRPDRHWIFPRLVFKGNRGSLSGMKWPGFEVDRSICIQCRLLRISGVILLKPYTPSWFGQGELNPLHFYL